MASAQTRPEPMNASPHHSKVKVTLTLGDSMSVAGTYVSGKMEMECRADKGLGIGVMMVELIASQELTSRDHSATLMFLHSRRVFQGPGLPPSNAVQAHPLPGDPILPQHYHQARRGISTFLFRIPIPSSSPSSINFASELAKVKYEVRASVGVFWKGDKRLVTNKRDLDVVESYEQDFSRTDPEAVAVGEHGKIWVHGRVVGGVVIAGESACIELQVKNHSNKKNTGLTLTLTRTLVLPGSKPGDKSPLQLSDVLTTVPFRGPEYIIPPGAEGVASLVFDVPKHARGVRGGTLEGDESEARTSESLFEVRCIISLRMTMGLGSKDIMLEIPVTVVHPSALPDISPPETYPPPAPYPYAATPVPGPYAYPALPVSPPIPPYIDQGHVWLPPPVSNTPQPYQYYTPLIEGQPYYFPPPPNIPIYLPARPVSAGPPGDDPRLDGIPPPIPQPLLPLGMGSLHPIEPEEGKGERALRVSQHLRLSSRHRSVSPQSHRFPLPSSNPLPTPPTKPKHHLRNLPLPPPISTDNLSVSQDAVVHSPRPFLSPKHSYSVDPITHNSLPKSERVEELERMAAEVEATTTDLSADIPILPVSPVAEDGAPNINKTLPIPPPPTFKEQKAPSLPERTRIDTYFDPPPVPVPDSEPLSPKPMLSDKTPPTPTLTAITPAKLPKSDYLAGLGRTESGLDALERRLLAEVGTRKIDLDNTRPPDVRSVVQPIAIPSKPPPEPLNDSAISSLTLAGGGEHDHDSDEKTHRAGKSSVSLSGDERAERRRRKKVEQGSSGGHGRSSKGDKKSGRKKDKDRAKDVEGQKAKKSAAKGRVAAWLGEIDPDVPPLEEVVPLSPTVIRKPPPFEEATGSAVIAQGAVQIDVKSDGRDSNDASSKDGEAPPKDVSSAPNPRSSGFVPIGTLKQDTFRGRPLTKEASVVEEARRVADIWSSSPEVKDISPVLPMISPLPRAPQSIRTDRNVSPPSALTPLQPDKPTKPAVSTNPKQVWQPAKAEPVTKPAITLPKKVVQPSPRLPAFPPPRLDPEVKYDIRSARGGRGGQVTSVASIWAAGGPAPASKSRDVQKKPPDLSTTPRPLRAPIKSTLSINHPSEGEPKLVGQAKSKDLQRKTPESSSKSKAPRAPIKSLLPNDSPPGGEPKPVGLAGKRARPVVKSSSVPAVISSSHATPMLSSTASLARPSPHRARSFAKIPSTIPETHSEGPAKTQLMTRAVSPRSTPTAGGDGDLAFGQARLRDLIKKYQGQST